MTPPYLSDEYFARYGDALQKAAELGQMAKPGSKRMYLRARC